MKVRTYSPLWSQQDVTILLAMKEAGCTPAQMGVAVNRTGHACKEKLRQLFRRKEAGTQTPKKTNRACMCCQRSFMSEGKGNRLCEHCKRSSNLDYATPSYGRF